MIDKNFSPWQAEEIIDHSQRLVNSFQYWTGKSLLANFSPIPKTPKAIAQQLFYAPFVLVSHGVEADPVLNYGNRLALKLWEMDWQDFIQTPSRLTAEPVEQVEREKLLAETKEKGFMTNYQGVRISSQGKKFFVMNAIIWNVIDDQQVHCGQAAMFSEYRFLS